MYNRITIEFFVLMLAHFRTILGYMEVFDKASTIFRLVSFHLKPV